MASSLNGTGVTFSNASTQAVAWVGGNGQVFTANGTFTIPTGVTAVKVTVVGGGGGGSRTFSGGSQRANGGGGGGAAIKFLTGLTPGNTLTVTRGAGGAGGTNLTDNGSAGGTSSVASGTQSISTISATGGAAGVMNATSGGAGGTGSGGDLNFVGGSGMSTPPNALIRVLGGSSIFGGASSSTGTNYGGGGGTTGVSDANGSAGATGCVMFEW